MSIVNRQLTFYIKLTHFITDLDTAESYITSIMGLHSIALSQLHYKIKRRIMLCNHFKIILFDFEIKGNYSKYRVLPATSPISLPFRAQERVLCQFMLPAVQVGILTTHKTGTCDPICLMSSRECCVG